MSASRGRWTMRCGHSQWSVRHIYFPDFQERIFMQVSRRNRITVGLATLALGLAWVAAPTASASADKPVAAAAEATNCTISAETKAVKCFSTATEAISFATNGQVTDAPRDMGEAIADPKVKQQINTPDVGATAVVIGIQYYLSNYGSHSLTVSGAGSCTTALDTVEYYVAPLPNLAPSGGINWNNNIRSFQGYNNCYQLMVDDAACTVGLYGWAGFAADLGAANDRTECIFWS
ncbi:hypothetical protein ACQPYE_33010 [Actinosynnema sp. CA-299493]